MASNGRKIHQQILALLARKDYQPLDKDGLAKTLGRKSGVRMGLSQALRELERAGEIARIRKNRYVLPARRILLPASYRFIKPAMVFSLQKNRASRIFSSRRKIPAQPCTVTA